MGWLRNFLDRLGGKPAPEQRRLAHWGRQGAVDDFRPGDLAECVDGGDWVTALGSACPGPVQGEVRMVASVADAALPGVTNGAFLWLTFARYGDQYYSARSFRKIIPRADAAERGTLAGLDVVAGKGGMAALAAISFDANGGAA